MCCFPLSSIFNCTWAACDIDADEAVKPVVLWSVEFRHRDLSLVCPSSHSPVNVHVVPLPGLDLDSDCIVEEVGAGVFDLCVGEVGAGVFGLCVGENGVGVFRLCVGEDGSGVFGRCVGEYGAGVFGLCVGEVGAGVFGLCVGEVGAGVFGLCVGEVGAGVFGLCVGEDGVGVFGLCVGEVGIIVVYSHLFHPTRISASRFPSKVVHAIISPRWESSQFPMNSANHVISHQELHIVCH